MGCLYIGGAQCVFAEFLKEDDVGIFDSKMDPLCALAEKFNIHIARKQMKDQGPYCFVLMNESPNTECFYDGATFEVDMSVNASDTFHARALACIDALNTARRLARFHNLQWSGPKILYFVSS